MGWAGLTLRYGNEVSEKWGKVFDFMVFGMVEVLGRASKICGLYPVVVKTVEWVDEAGPLLFGEHFFSCRFCALGCFLAKRG